jgi:hypothetical protein
MRKLLLVERRRWLQKFTHALRLGTRHWTLRLFIVASHVLYSSISWTRTVEHKITRILASTIEACSMGYMPQPYTILYIRDLESVVVGVPESLYKTKTGQGRFNVIQYFDVE